MKLHSKHLGIALGLTFASLVLIIGVSSLVGLNLSSFIMLGGFGAQGTIVDIIVSAILAFVNGFIIGSVLDYFYKA